MCFSAIAVANTILDMAAKRNIPDMTPMKLQKLVFLTHALYVRGNIYFEQQKALIKSGLKIWRKQQESNLPQPIG